MNVNELIAQCESTNESVKALGRQNHPSGTWLAAEVQTGGRGRQGRSWESIKGNLHLSVLIRMSDRTRWTWIPILSAVAVADVLQKKFPELGIGLKWPNDLICGVAKLGGVLVESVNEGANSFLVVGVGLNCLMVPPVKDRRVTSLSAELGKAIHARDLLPDILFWLKQKLALLPKMSADDLREAFCALSVHALGDPIKWKGKEGTQEGVFEGIGDFGEMIIRTQARGSVRLLSEELEGN